MNNTKTNNLYYFHLLFKNPSDFFSRTISYIKHKNPIPDSFPKRICIELTNRCNLNCPFCLVGQQNTKSSTEHDELDRDMGGMNYENCKKTIINAKQSGIKEVNFTFQGEPLMYKRKAFLDLIKICKKEGLRSIVYTNGFTFRSRIFKEYN